MNFLRDMRFGMRMLVKDPGFTAIVVITLALGIGANTTVFTLLNAVLFKGLPFERSERIMHLSSNNLPKGTSPIRKRSPMGRDHAMMTSRTDPTSFRYDPSLGVIMLIAPPL